MSNQISPLYKPERGWTLHFKSDIYTGINGTGNIVPNVGDAVFSWENGYEKCIAVETKNKTYISTLGPANELPTSGVSSSDIMLANAGGSAVETYRLLVNKTLDPITAICDARLFYYNTKARYMKVFLGKDTSQSGEVISATYDNSGNYLTENVDIVAGTNGHMVPADFHLTRNLPSGETVTAVAYNDEHQPISFAVMLLRDCSLTRKLAVQNKVVTDIRLKSIWASNTEENTLLVPVNVPVSDIRADLIVTYNGNEDRVVPIDGRRAVLGGLDDFVSQSPGQKIPLTMTYYLESNEEAVSGKNGLKRHFSKPASARSIEADGAYSLKLFVCPEWISDALGYKLRFYLFNLDGTRTIEVTNSVTVESTNGEYVPYQYGKVQTLIASLRVKDVLISGSDFIHTQNFNITLGGPGDEAGDSYILDYHNGSPFGENLSAQLRVNGDSTYSVNLRSSAMSEEEWVNRMYNNTAPLFGIEGSAPREPTHFELIYDDKVVRYTIDQYDQNVLIPATVLPMNGDQLLIRFVKVVGDQDIYLSQASLFIIN